MFNVFVFKKWTALLIISSLSVISFFLGITMFNLIWAVGFWFIGALIGSFIAVAMLKNPFNEMLEGKGILVEDENSTGILKWSIVKVNPPYIEGKVSGQDIKETFDRNATFQLAEPIIPKKQSFLDKIFNKKQDSILNTATPIQIKDNDGKVLSKGIQITLQEDISEDKFNKSRFALYHYPVLKYNSQIKSFITKDFLSEREKEVFAEHSILNLLRRVESLDESIRNYARYVVDTVLRPKNSLFSGMNLFWIITIGLVILGLVIFGPQIWATFTGGAQSIIPATSNLNPQTVVPR